MARVHWEESEFSAVARRFGMAFEISQPVGIHNLIKVLNEAQSILPPHRQRSFNGGSTYTVRDQLLEIWRLAKEKVAEEMAASIAAASSTEAPKPDVTPLLTRFVATRDPHQRPVVKGLDGSMKIQAIQPAPMLPPAPEGQPIGPMSRIMGPLIEQKLSEMVPVLVEQLTSKLMAEMFPHLIIEIEARLEAHRRSMIAYFEGTPAPQVDVAALPAFTPVVASSPNVSPTEGFKDQPRPAAKAHKDHGRQRVLVYGALPKQGSAIQDRVPGLNILTSKDTDIENMSTHFDAVLIFSKFTPKSIISALRKKFGPNIPLKVIPGSVSTAVEALVGPQASTSGGARVFAEQ